MAARDWGGFPLPANRVLGLAQGSLEAGTCAGLRSRRHLANYMRQDMRIWLVKNKTVILRSGFVYFYLLG